MKETKINKVIPEHIKEETLFECEHCKFTTTDKYVADMHEFNNHYYLKHISAGGKDLYWFEDKDRAEYWFKDIHPKEDLLINWGYDTDSYTVYWKRPGWYVVSKFYHKYDMFHVDDHLANEKHLLDKIKNSISEIEAATV